MWRRRGRCDGGRWRRENDVEGGGGFENDEGKGGMIVSHGSDADIAEAAVQIAAPTASASDWPGQLGGRGLQLMTAMARVTQSRKIVLVNLREWERVTSW